MVRLSQILILVSITLGADGIATAQTGGGAVLLKNDRMLVGRVESHGALVSITIANDSRVSIPIEQVRHVGKDPSEIYDFKFRSTTKWDIGDHFQMTRWCLLNDFLDQATFHYQEVTKIRADHPRVRQLGIELQKKLLEQPEFREFLGLSPVTNHDDDDSHRADPGLVTDAVVMAGATAELTAMHPEIAAGFSSRIQPILLNRCSQAACHGMRSQNSLTLMEPYDRAFARISSQNLSSVLSHLSMDGNTISPLLKYATTAHGIQREPAISLTESQLLAELGTWIKRVQNPVIPAVGYGSTAGRSRQVRPAQTSQYVPYTPAVKLMPVPSGANGLRQVPRSDADFPQNDRPTLAEIDALDAQVRRALGETTNPARQSTVYPQTQPIGAGSQAKPDPFDPEEFNKKSQE